MIKKQDNNQDDPKGNPSGEGMHHIFVCTESLFTTTFLNSWVLGLSILVLHHILLEIINLLLPCKQFQEEIDMST